jgi:hypothetical protein
MGEVRSINSKNAKQKAFNAQKTRDENFVRSEFKKNLFFYDE